MKEVKEKFDEYVDFVTPNEALDETDGPIFMRLSMIIAAYPDLDGMFLGDDFEDIESAEQVN